jgi:hypothetical protein
MLNNRAEQIREWHEQAVYCAQQADARTDPKVKQQFLELKRLWLLLARSVGSPKARPTFPTRPCGVFSSILRAINFVLMRSVS